MLAVLKREADATVYAAILCDPRQRLALPASCFLEPAMTVSATHGMRGLIDELIAEQEIAILAIDETIARMAAVAFARYGCGQGHPARLNIGVCLSYAAARVHDAALLFKGDDFRHTDVKAAI